MAQIGHTTSAVIDPVDGSWAATDPGPVREETYRSVAMEDPERQWELHDGLLREKPGMGMGHNDVMMYLVIVLAPPNLIRASFAFVPIRRGCVCRPGVTTSRTSLWFQQNTSLSSPTDQTILSTTMTPLHC
jgi:hypothetical protein